MSSRTSKSNQDLQFANNPATRCPVALVLDTSTSMEGAPINRPMLYGMTVILGFIVPKGQDHRRQGQFPRQVKIIHNVVNYIH